MKLCLLVFFALLYPFGASSSEQVRLLTEDFPPFGYVQEGELEGIGPEIVRKLMQSEHIAADKIEVFPWKRAYHLALNEANIGIFSMNRIRQRESSFKWVGPLYSVHDYLYARSDFGARLNKLEDAKSIGLILVQAGGASETELRALGFDNLLPMSNPSQQLRMLLVGRAKLLHSTDIVIQYQLNLLGKAASTVKPVLELGRSDFYLAFSNSTSDQVVDAWQRAVDQMEQSGELDQIRSKFLTARD